MFLFLKLVLAHMVADFILQFEELYQLKLRSRMGHAAHVLMHLLMMALLVIPYKDRADVWIFILVITVIHYIQDNIKYAGQAKNPKQTFWYFTVDQLVHVLFIAGVFLIPSSRETLTFPDHFFGPIYASHNATLLLILFIGVTFKSSYFLHSFRKSFMPGRPDHFITSFEMTWALVERTLIAACFLDLSLKTFLISLTPALVRPFSKKLRDPLDFALSYAYAAAAGWIFHYWTV